MLAVQERGESNGLLMDFIRYVVLVWFYIFLHEERSGLGSRCVYRVGDWYVHTGFILRHYRVEKGRK